LEKFDHSKATDTFLRNIHSAKEKGNKEKRIKKKGNVETLYFLTQLIPGN